MEPTWKAELIETLPDGTERYKLVRTKPLNIGKGAEPKEHECPHCGRTIYYRFDTDSFTTESYISEHTREEESI